MSSKQTGKQRSTPISEPEHRPEAAGPAYSGNADMVAWLGLGLTGCSETQQGATDDPLAYTVTLLYPSLSPDLQDSVDPSRLGDLALGVYQEEAERMDWVDRAEMGDTLGPGQLGEPAFIDVTKKFATEWAQFREHYAIPDDITWQDAVKDERASNFFTVGYLIISANKSVKPGRTDDDALKFGVGRYHGGFAQMKGAQDKSGEPAAFEPLRVHLDDDFENYVDDATAYRSKK